MGQVAELRRLKRTAGVSGDCRRLVALPGARSTLGTQSVCEATAAAISWHRDINGVDAPTRSGIINKLIRGAKRLYAKPVVVRKSAFTLELLKRAESRIDIVKFIHLQLLHCKYKCILCFGYLGFFLFIYIIRVALKNIIVLLDKSFITIFPLSSKSDAFSEGPPDVIASSLIKRPQYLSSDIILCLCCLLEAV